jgi:esterase/lipase superfamily enzyme
MTAQSRSGLFGRLLRVAAWAAIAPIVAVLTVLGAVFLYFSPIPWAPLRAAIAVAFVLGVIAGFVVLKRRVKALGVVVALMAGLLLWYSLIPPSSDALLTARLAKRPTKLMPTPNIYASGMYPLFGDLAPELQTSTVDLLYMTDRAPHEEEDGGLGYGFERSWSLAFGSCLVEIGEHLDWDRLVAESTARDRSLKAPLTVRSITELGRLGATPLPVVDRGGQFVDDPAAVGAQAELAEGFREEVRKRLALTTTKSAFVYVHGFHNSFNYGACVVTEFWHFAGRVGVPILYSWPAGSPGLIKGYSQDRESGEFTVYHLKQFIRTLSELPELQRIHVIAHSRGTDVAASALRELLIEERGAGRDARESFKIGQVLLASPDADIDVVSQRFEAERFFRVAEHVTIYVSAHDRAIGLADWLHRSRRRLGQLRPEELSAVQIERFAQGSVDIVDARVETGLLGHSYFHSNPAVSSDLFLLLRYGAAAGSPQRPLKRVAPHYWVLDDEGYPAAGQ